MRLFHKIGLTVSLGAALANGAAVAQQQQFINVLTGGQSGVYYPIGVALSQIFAKDIPNVRATAQVTKASAENLNLLRTPGRATPRRASPRNWTSCVAWQAPTATTSRSWPAPTPASRHWPI